MNKDLEIHSAQAFVLRELLFKREAKFAELNILKLTTDHFTFHIKSLVEAGLIEKTKKGYQLTIIGKEFANHLDTDSKNLVIEKQAKIGALVCGIKKEKGIAKYLIQQRLKEPYFGYFGFVTGKVRKRETLFEGAEREFKEETGLEGKLSLVGIKHKMDYSKEKELLEDKVFFVFRVDQTKGKLTPNFEGGKNIWMTEEEIIKLPNQFDGVPETIAMSKQKKLSFSETKYKVKGF